MKRNTYFNLVIFLVVMVITGLRGINDPLKDLKAKLARYNSIYPTDKVYLQFDKPFYKPGEDIWFNAFVLNGNSHLPSSISDVLYVELLDPKGNVSSKLELLVRDGTAFGDFSLPETTAGGIFKVRAFTQWMRNDGTENYFTKDIQVQRVITPQLLLKLDFEKESYGPGDKVTSLLTVSNLKNEKASGAHVRAIISVDGKKLNESEFTTDSKGGAQITFDLPANLTSADGLLQAIVTHHGVEESISRAVPIVLNKITIGFFPEGGHALEGVSGSTAFKAVNEFGKGADVSGSIVDEKGQTITTFESFHMGMGAFGFTPLPGKKYFARIDRPVGNTMLTALPEPLMAGFALNLISQNEMHLRWRISSSVSTSGYLVGQSHGSIITSSLIDLDNGSNEINVPVDKFPKGIAVFTLFDRDGMEQCERLVFVNPAKGLNIRLTTDKDLYLPGEKVTVKVETTDNSGKPVPAKLSLSVADDKLISFADDKQDNILSSLFLSSEVKGKIQEPSFYFDPEEAKAPRALDYLLMTQGWRRFTWEEVRNPEKQVTYAPEKIKNISGHVVNSNGKGISSEVSLLELANKRRIIKVMSANDGYFLFRNVDPTVPILLLVRKPGEITLEKERTFSISLLDKDKNRTYESEERFLAIRQSEGRADQDEETSSDNDVAIESELDIDLSEDATQLSEVVVVGYGTEQRSKLTSSSIVTVRTEELEFTPGTIEQMLQGRVTGLAIQPQTSNPGAAANITIRGFNSFAGRNEPLYVVDGHPIGTSLNQNFSNGTILSPDDIESITVLHSPEATALYGSRASSGVIAITTRSRIGYTAFREVRKPARFSSTTIKPRTFSATREFYTDPPSKTNKEAREDFRTTLYWNHSIVTDSKGKGEITFYNNDAISAFRMTAEGFSNAGLIGRTEKVYFTELPYSVTAKIPGFLGLEDLMRLPVVVKNETSAILKGSLELRLSGELSAVESAKIEIQIPPNTSETFYYSITSKGITGDFPITIDLNAGNFHDELKQTIKVQPVGFPVKLSFSSKDTDKTVHFDISDSEKGSMKAKLTAYPDALSDLLAGAESIFHEPYGCFEQVSSSTFPNILALQFIKQSGISKPAIEKMALKYIYDGYNRLMAYEINGGGFEWFGHPAAHEGLTAYGLLEFHEMKKVFSGVNEDMVARTKDWLLSRRDGRGGFRQNEGKYGFSSASGVVNNAYIVYALAETGTQNVNAEYDKAYNEAISNKDMYRMALMANASFNLKQIDNYNRLIKLFIDLTPAGFDNLTIDHSIVRSYGKSLEIETIALWAIAMMKSPEADYSMTRKCIDHIISNRSRGGFGSTQATVLALKALTEYGISTKTTEGDGEIQVMIGNTLAARTSFASNTTDKIELKNFHQHFTAGGVQTMRILFQDKKTLPYTVDIEWYTKKPQSDKNCKVGLATTLGSSRIRVNETIRLSVRLSNKSSEGLPMTLAVIGIPAGLSVQPWQLKDLQEKQVFDFYEIMDGKLVLYYTEMAPGEEKTINLDLKAEIPGSYTGSASSAYLYYTNEHRSWAMGTSVVVE